jgi:hypothetical protein
MIPATEPTVPGRGTRSNTGLGYPLASVVVGVARDQDDRDTTERTEDGTAR